MVGDILRSVSDSEAEAARIIEEAKSQAASIKAGAADDIAAKKTSEAVDFQNEADRRREAVKEEEERKDKEHALRVSEELDVMAGNASGKESQIVEELSKRVYAI